MHGKLSTTFLALSVLASANSAAHAQGLQQVVHVVDVQRTPGDWSRTVDVPRFDGSLGTLQSVQFDFTASARASIGEENVDAVPAQANVNVTSAIGLTLPNGSGYSFTVPMAAFSDSLDAFDGTFDYGGTSGMMRVGIEANSSTSVNLASDTDDLSAYVDATGGGFVTASITSSTVSNITASAKVMTRVQQTSGARLVVTYTYAVAATAYIGEMRPTLFADAMSMSAVAANSVSKSTVSRRTVSKHTASTNAPIASRRPLDVARRDTSVAHVERARAQHDELCRV